MQPSVFISTITIIVPHTVLWILGAREQTSIFKKDQPASISAINNSACPGDWSLFFMLF